MNTETETAQDARAVRAGDRARIVEPAPGLQIDLAEHHVSLDGREIRLGVRQYRALALLASDPARAFTRAELTRAVWGGEQQQLAIDRTLLALRYTLKRRCVENVWGVGWRLLPHQLLQHQHR